MKHIFQAFDVIRLERNGGFFELSTSFEVMISQNGRTPKIRKEGERMKDSRTGPSK